MTWSLVPDALVKPCGVFQKPPISWDFHVKQSLEFTQNGAQNKKHPGSAGVDALLHLERSEEDVHTGLSWHELK